MLFQALEESSVFSVSDLNAQIKALLESKYRFIWVRGEISNFRAPASGHFYFTLKDEHSQIRAVLFRPQQRHLRFLPESGMQVLCQGRISVYEPRGEYQIIVDVMEPQGVGALHLAFEQLKKKLEKEGLFDPSLKRSLPCCPQRIAIVTSATGAAIRDMLKVLQRSPYPLTVTLLPVRVQGQEAAAEIAAAINIANQLAEEYRWDLLIVGRGGGSIEDLWSFNEELVARAVVSSRIPTISAVGHEIDYTIADMVSDLRAPTPTAAAEWVVSQLESLQRQVAGCLDRMHRMVFQEITSQTERLGFLQKRLVDPRRRLGDLRLFLDDRLDRLQLAVSRRLEKLRMHHTHLAERLNFHQPLRDIYQLRTLLTQHYRKLTLQQHKMLERNRFEFQKYALQLDSLNPLAVLARGYSITYRLPDNTIVREAKEVQSGQDVRIQLAKGRLECTVRKTDEQAPGVSQRRMNRGQEEK